MRQILFGSFAAACRGPKPAARGLMLLVLAAVVFVPRLQAQTPAAPSSGVSTTSAPPATAQPLFPDKILAKGDGVEVRSSQLEEAYIELTANLAANGRVLPEERRQATRRDLLQRMIVTQLLVKQATAADRTRAKQDYNKFMSNLVQDAGSVPALDKQLIVRGLKPAKFRQQIRRRAICEEVLNREVKSKIPITEAEIRKYYTDHQKVFQRPEMVHVRHLFLSTRDPATGRELSPEAKRKKVAQIKAILQRARKGEDFAKLVKEYSESPNAATNGGEATFARNQVAPEIEAAAFSLHPHQISDVIETADGLHLLQLIEKIPAHKLSFAEAREGIRARLLQAAIDKRLPAFFNKLKKEAHVKVMADALDN